MTNTALLKYIINSHNETMKELAPILGVTLATLYNKVNQKDGRCFTQDEIEMIAYRYHLTPEDVFKVFFTRDPNEPFMGKNGKPIDHFEAPKY